MPLSLNKDAAEKYKQALASPDHSGFLDKKASKGNGWLRRWFFLKNGHIFYCAKEQGKPSGIINLFNAVVESDDSWPFSFTILATKSVSGSKRWNDRTYLLAAKNQEERDAWLSALAKVKGKREQVVRKMSVDHSSLLAHRVRKMTEMGLFFSAGFSPAGEDDGSVKREGSARSLEGGSSANGIASGTRPASAGSGSDAAPTTGPDAPEPTFVVDSKARPTTPSDSDVVRSDAPEPAYVPLDRSVRPSTDAPDSAVRAEPPEGSTPNQSGRVPTADDLPRPSAPPAEKGPVRSQSEQTSSSSYTLDVAKSQPRRASDGAVLHVSREGAARAEPLERQESGASSVTAASVDSFARPFYKGKQLAGEGSVSEDEAESAANEHNQSAYLTRPAPSANELDTSVVSEEAGGENSAKAADDDADAVTGAGRVIELETEPETH